MKIILSVLFIFLISEAVSLAQTQLFIPDTLSGPDYELMIHQDSVQFFPGPKTHTYSYNNFHYLGPTLILNKNSNIHINVHNQLDDTTTVHWHGLHLPAIWDGGPHAVILPNESWSPEFTVMNNAGTYWYHPHTHMKTAEQAIKGAIGMILIRDNEEAALTLPRKYGVDDIPLIIQCQEYDSNQANPRGMEDSIILVNGARANYDGYYVYANLPAQVVRLRLLNASGERVFNFGFSGNKEFKMIASDGGLLNVPVSLTRIRLAPGERAEILLDLTGIQGQSLYLMCYGSELPMGVQGGPTMPMPEGSPSMNSPLNGENYNIMEINVSAPTDNPITTIPDSLTTNVTYNDTSVKENRTIRFTADSFMVMDGPFYFNDSSFNMMRIDYKIPVNNVEKWKLKNETMVAHPFHIHDVQFFITDRNGMPPQPEEAGPKDVVLVLSGDSVEFITQFKDYTDTLIPYMYHCHILMHEDDGMMGQFTVIPEQNSSTDHFTLTKVLKIYPNPSREYLNIDNPDKRKSFDVRITDVSGRVVISENNKKSEAINISSLNSGPYIIIIKSGDQFYKATFIKA